MLTNNINFKDFSFKKSSKKISNIFKNLITEDNPILKSLEKSYKDNYKKKIILKFKNFSEILIIGMGGSVLGARSIYSFLKEGIKKKFHFVDDLELIKIDKSKKKKLYLIISKSGNTLETISNSNVLLKKGDKNIFITENKDNYLINLAKKMKSEIVHHNNFIGGRYSVLSEVGMLPAELMGFKASKFRRLNFLIKNKKFINSLIQNVSNTLHLIRKKKCNSIILNYDKQSSDFFSWYQQLIAESLGKKGKGILPVISNMPKDNHSLMQLYLDGVKNSFFTFFFVNESLSPRINNKMLIKTHSYLNNKTLHQIKKSQFEATMEVFKKKNIPFRGFLLEKRNEESLGELFTFFILETILLGKALKVNPYDQPAVELIKTKTKKFLIKI